MALNLLLLERLSHKHSFLLNHKLHNQNGYFWFGIIFVEENILMKKKEEKNHFYEQFKLKFYAFMTYQQKIIRLSHVWYMATEISF